MEQVWYRHDDQAVIDALRRGERPDMATTMASGPLDDLVGLHEELGILAILDSVVPSLPFSAENAANRGKQCCQFHRSVLPLSSGFPSCPSIIAQVHNSKDGHRLGQLSGRH